MEICRNLDSDMTVSLALQESVKNKLEDALFHRKGFRLRSCTFRRLARRPRLCFLIERSRYLKVATGQIPCIRGVLAGYFLAIS